MKLVKQILAFVLIILIFVLYDVVIYNTVTRRYINQQSKEMRAKSVELSEYLPFEEDSNIARIDSSVKLTDDIPVVDGAAALYPVFSSFVNAVYSEDCVCFDGVNFTSESKLQYRNTKGAYKAVVDGDADIIFVAKPSDEQLNYAREKGVELEFVPIGYEAFVFIVNKSNPVDELSVSQVRGIYSGEYSKWSQVGGDDRNIDAVQRNEGSGSQTAMKNFMSGVPMIRRNAGLNASAIGFSFRYYVEGIVENGNVKMISLNGVYPSKENIADGIYPIVSNFYAVYDCANDNKNIPVFIDWILSDEGQNIVEKCGYVPVN